MSMSRVPWSTFARCRVCLAMVDIRPPIGADGRHSTVDLSRPEFQDYMSNNDFSWSHLSGGPVARFAAPSGLLATGSNGRKTQEPLASSAVVGAVAIVARLIFSVPLCLLT